MPANIIMGTGCSTSENWGANIFESLANKLHMPFVDDAKITGNSIELAFQSMLMHQLLPKFEISRNKGIRLGCSFRKSRYIAAPIQQTVKEAR